MARTDVNPIIKRNVMPAKRRAAAKYIDDALSTPRLWGAREYLQANGDIPEGSYVIFNKFPNEKEREYHFGEVAKKTLGAVETLKFRTLYRNSSVDWLFHIDAGALLWGPLRHPQEFCYGGVESEDYVADDRDEEEL